MTPGRDRIEEGDTHRNVNQSTVHLFRGRKLMELKLEIEQLEARIAPGGGHGSNGSHGSKGSHGSCK